MVLNLLENVIRYTPPGAHVEVRLTRAGSAYVMAVRDRGPGIPIEAQPHVFERFYQVNAARFHDHGGSGAGARPGHHPMGRASTWVLEQSDQSGSTFVVRLPRATTDGR